MLAKEPSNITDTNARVAEAQRKVIETANNVATKKLAKDTAETEKKTADAKKAEADTAVKEAQVNLSKAETTARDTRTKAEADKKDKKNKKEAKLKSETDAKNAEAEITKVKEALEKAKQAADKANQDFDKANQDFDNAKEDERKAGEKLNQAQAALTTAKTAATVTAALAEDEEISSVLLTPVVLAKAPSDLLTVSSVKIESGKTGSEDQIYFGTRNGTAGILQFSKTKRVFFADAPIDPVPMQVVPSAVPFPVRKIYFHPTTADGYLIKGNTVFKKPKGGETWVQFYSYPSVENNSVELFSLAFTGEKVCVVGVKSKMQNKQEIVVGGVLDCIVSRPEKNVIEPKATALPIPSQMLDISFSDSFGLAVDGAGISYFTEDGGKNWSELNSDAKKPLLSIAFSGKTGWAVGFNKTIIFTEPKKEESLPASGKPDTKTNPPTRLKGQKPDVTVKPTTPATTASTAFRWKPWKAAVDEIKDPEVNLRAVKFSQDGKYGWIVGDKGVILQTDDSGKTWKNVDLSRNEKPLKDGKGGGESLRQNDLTFYAIDVDENHCWIVGSKGVVVRLEYKAGEQK